MNRIGAAKAYRFLGPLLLGDRVAIKEARRTPPLAGASEGISDADLDAQHHATFSLEAFPFAGVFTEKEALVGGPIAARASSILESNDNGAHLAAESGDHLGNLFLAAAVLLESGREAEAREFVASAIHSWIEPWLCAVRRHAAGFWRAVVETSVELVDEHVGEASRPVALSAPIQLSESLGVAGLAAALVKPSVSGALICRADIRAIGRQLELPTGFGARRVMLTNLFRSAAEYGKGPALLAGLAELFRDQEGEGPFAERSRTTAKSLEAMKTELEGAIEVR